jgi:hypothetical protein
MLARRREQILLLIGLGVVNGLLAWRASQLWSAYHHRVQWVYAGTNMRAAAPGNLRTARSNAAAPRSFAAIVDHDLFQPDRNVKRPEEAKRPGLPLLYGSMNLGDGWFALMAPGDQPSSLPKKVLAGGEIGGYKLVSIGNSRVVVEWNGQQFPVDVGAAVRRASSGGERASETSSASSNPRSVPAARAPNVTVIGEAPSASAGNAGAEAKKFTPAGYNAPPSAPVDAPEGTIIGGKRKVVVRSPFGASVVWVDVAKPKPQQAPEAPQNQGKP